MTTFFRLSPGRRVVDAWSERVASFRTSEIVAIRRVEDLEAPVPVPVPDLLAEPAAGGRIALRSA